MRTNLALMDLVRHKSLTHVYMHVHVFIFITRNESANRAHTSVHAVQDLHRPDRRTPIKFLVKQDVFFC